MWLHTGPSNDRSCNVRARSLSNAVSRKLRLRVGTTPPEEVCATRSGERDKVVCHLLTKETMEARGQQSRPPAADRNPTHHEGRQGSCGARQHDYRCRDELPDSLCDEFRRHGQRHYVPGMAVLLVEVSDRKHGGAARRRHGKRQGAALLANE